ASLATYAITHQDFEVLHDILTVLNLAHCTQELLSSDKTPTLSHALPLYHALVDEWRILQAKLPALSHAIGAGIKKLEHYLVKTRSSPAYIVAMVLNPSIGYQWIDRNWTTNEALNARAIVKQHMRRCLEEQQRECLEAVALFKASPSVAEVAAKRLNNGYSTLLTSAMNAKSLSNQVTPTHTPSTTSATPATTPTSGSPTNSPSSATPSPTRLYVPPTSALNNATVELEHQKLEEEVTVLAEDLGGLSPIDYWQAKSAEMPLTYRVALDILPAQASSVSSERVFSLSKLTCTQSRNQISASNVEALQILKHSLRCDPDTPLLDIPDTLDFMAHHLDEMCGDAAVLTVE
ncbi:hypothetical protein FRC07_001502, partial [Ceratobasidium sp. 392]